MEDTSSHLSEKILNLTLEIIHLLTGEDCRVVKKTSEEAALIPRPSSLLQKEDYEKKILHLTNQIIQMISGEVPLRCEDVTVHFTMEEWDYVEEHERLYKDLIIHGPHDSRKSMEDHPTKSPHHTSQGTEMKQEAPEDKLHIPLHPAAVTKDLPRPPPPDTPGPPPEISEMRRNLKQRKCFVKKPTRISSKTSDSPRNSRSAPDMMDAPPKSDERATKMTSDITDFPCPECDRSFKLKKSLDIHTKTHTGERPLVCPECGKSFIHHRSLRDHLRIHTGEKPFLCTECGKCFGYKVALLRHQRTHTGVKPYACSECGKSFATKTALTRHELIHKKEKFPCSSCNAIFNQEEFLIAHERTHKGEAPCSCCQGYISHRTGRKCTHPATKS